MVYESYPKLQKNYIFIYFEMPLKKMIEIHFSSLFLFKLTLVANHNCICNYKQLFSCSYDYKSFYHGAIEDSRINN
jgi:hypothetical protein